MTVQADTDEVVIGHRTNNGGWQVDSTFDTVIEAGVDYELSLSLNGTRANVKLDGNVLPGYDFSGLVVDGSFGLLSTDGMSSFDSVRIRTDDPAFDDGGVNAAPIATDDAFTTERGTAIVINVLANDIDANFDSLTVTTLTQPSLGAVVLNADKTVTYTPAPGFVGTENFTTALLDWRRYWQVDRNLTVAFRGLHYGRYGAKPDETFTGTGIQSGSVVQPLFLGYETFIRGYAYESFTSSECDASGGVAAGTLNGCPAFDRLLGQRLGVMNFEFRIPLLGVEQFGLFNFPYLPTELLFFADAGFAWNENADFENIELFDRSSGGTGPVYSVGVSARTNILGFLIVEIYYANPFQRPEKGWH